MFKDSLEDLLVELQNRRREKDVLFAQLVKDRLDKSLISYYEELYEQTHFLKKKSCIKLQGIIKNV